MADIAIINIEKSFRGSAVLDRVSLDVRQGEFLSILGPSGCGKSTLLKLIAGIDTADAGEIRIGGQQVDGLGAGQRDLAMVFQSYALYPHLTARQNIAVPLEMRRLSTLQRLPILGRLLPGAGVIRHAIREDVAAAAAQARLTHRLDRKPRQLSGGERQRVAIARALVRRPGVLLMDEPLSNLDAQLRVAMRAELADLHARLGLTIVFVTHDQAEAMSISHRVAVMMGGKLQQLDAPKELYDAPANLAVARFIGGTPINVFPARVVGPETADVAGVTMHFDRVPAADAGAASIGVRPEWLLPVEVGTAASWNGVVTHMEYLGAEALVSVKLAKSDQVVALRWDGDWPLPKTGDLLAFQARPSRGLLFDETGLRVGQSRPAPRLAVAS